MTDDASVRKSCGNFFADLGIENADEYMAKSEPAAEILRIVRRRRLTQGEASKLLGIREPKVSELHSEDRSAVAIRSMRGRSQETSRRPFRVPLI